MVTQVAQAVDQRQPKRFWVVYPWEVAGKLWWLLIRKLNSLRKWPSNKLDALISYDMATTETVKCSCGNPTADLVPRKGNIAHEGRTESS